MVHFHLCEAIAQQHRQGWSSEWLKFDHFNPTASGGNYAYEFDLLLIAYDRKHLSTDHCYVDINTILKEKTMSP